MGRHIYFKHASPLFEAHMKTDPLTNAGPLPHPRIKLELKSSVTNMWQSDLCSLYHRPCPELPNPSLPQNNRGCKSILCQLIPYLINFIKGDKNIHIQSPLIFLPLPSGKQDTPWGWAGEWQGLVLGEAAPLSRR